MKNIPTQQEVIDLLKTSRVDENGHLFITLELYNSYSVWFLGTLNQKNKRDFLEMKYNHPTKFESTVCNFISGSYQSVTYDFTRVSTVCVELLDGSYDYVNV